MTHEEQVQAALELLQPNDREQCRADIVQMLSIVDEETDDELTSALWASKQVRAKVKALRTTADKFRIQQNDLVKTLKNAPVLDVERQLDFYNEILKQPSEAMQHTAVRQPLAAAGAQALLFDYSVKPAVTRLGVWDRLAAILYGDSSANMFRYIRELKDVY